MAEEYKGFYITEETLLPGSRWCIYRNRQSWLDDEPEIHRAYSLSTAKDWIDRKAYEPLEEGFSPIRKQLAAIGAKQGNPLCEELPVMEKDHEACRNYGFKGAVRKFHDKDTGMISTFCEL